MLCLTRLGQHSVEQRLTSTFYALMEKHFTSVGLARGQAYVFSLFVQPYTYYFVHLHFRLQAYIRNSNFVKEDQQIANQDVYKMSKPSLETYKDIHGASLLPNITPKRIELFLARYLVYNVLIGLIHNLLQHLMKVMFLDNLTWSRPYTFQCKCNEYYDLENAMLLVLKQLTYH